MAAPVLDGGFADPAPEAARAFRSLMEAMARPGTIHRISGAGAPEPLSPAAGAVLLTLCDGDTPVCLTGSLDVPAVRSWLAFHTGAPLTDPTQAMFAVGDWAALAPLSAYPIGTPEYPDRSATLIVECTALVPEGATLRGPGIKGAAQLSLPEVAAFQENAARFPLGLDFVFTAGHSLAALPRTTEVR